MLKAIHATQAAIKPRPDVPLSAAPQIRVWGSWEIHTGGSVRPQMMATEDKRQRAFLGELVEDCFAQEIVA